VKGQDDRSWLLRIVSLRDVDEIRAFLLAHLERPGVVARAEQVEVGTE